MNLEYRVIAGDFLEYNIRMPTHTGVPTGAAQLASQSSSLLWFGTADDTNLVT